ncbi:calreticulin family protein [Cardiosporidium cionae]|uniref:Calreticulin family protein n=1 Tax=Cardiosporidium cionae TaxID=476202 RepID=A0ABQ7JCR1_9APIC|nr:calreticulin family protein [Cardiosporidium cionae]|eukprot:KAF8821797.1 calreticulin family protein [Cardiosporidium cionae]
MAIYRKLCSSSFFLCLSIGLLCVYYSYNPETGEQTVPFGPGYAVAQEKIAEPAKPIKEKVYIHDAGSESGTLYDLDEEGRANVDPPAFVDTSVNEDEEDVLPEPVNLIKYTSPSTKGLLFAELFDTNPFEGSSPRWIFPSDSKFNGEVIYTRYETEAIEGDYGIRLNSESSFHGAATHLPAFGSFVGKTFVLQYEVKMENMLLCGGAYLKLLNLEGASLDTFNANSPYAVMFGPDKCGTGTNKVHFIFKYKNKNGEWSEHHMPNAPSVPSDTLSHVYTLVLKPDNTYEVWVDQSKRANGNFLTDFSPSILLPKLIPDSSDVKPSDWVDAVKITDVNAVKPDDWDETQPSTVEDDEAVMPEGWLEDEEEEIPDMEIVKPEEWDDEEDGEWEPSLIKNPKCEAAPGCGPWKRPQKMNPLYKGPWMPPLISNPDYIGQWKPREIPNENYFEDENAYVLPTVDALGFELWNVESGILFDNIIITDDFQKAQDFAEATWRMRQTVEKKLLAADEIVNEDETVPVPSSFLGELIHLYTVLSKDFSIYFWSAVAGARVKFEGVIEVLQSEYTDPCESCVVGISAFLTMALSGGSKKVKTVSSEPSDGEVDASDEAAGTDNSEEETNAVKKRSIHVSKKRATRM